MIGFGLYHLAKPVRCTTCDHHFAGATLTINVNDPPVCPSCGADTLKLIQWDDVVIVPKADANHA